MTKKLYWETAAVQAQALVLQCESLPQGGYGVRLDRTLFHPQGGGQPGDAGWINGIAVTHVEMAGADIVHRTQQPIAPGAAMIEVDGEKRRLHARLHSMGHLIGHALQPLGWQPIRAHHWPGEARVVFKAGADAPPMAMEDIQRLCHALVEQELPCKVQVNEQGFREVGFGELPAYGCGGTHVASTAELRGFRLLSAPMKKGQLSVQYDMDEVTGLLND